MKLSTRNSLLGKIADKLNINIKFNEYTRIFVDLQDTAIISPVEAKVMHIGNINQNGMLISKNNKKILLSDLIGRYSYHFLDGNYINFYLRPSDKHFWITPCDGMFIYTQKNDGRSRLPVYLGLENLLGINMLSKAVKKNASIGSVFKTKDFFMAIIAIGSLNVNRIHIDYEEMRNYAKGTPCGYFSIGSTLLLCFPNQLKLLIEENSKVKIGQRILI
ncbi:phosphatidylserine decarboxylase [bacterium BMS3Abin03]|nr:phosphatidylserine decarboxylase [bacterium BMS3Abin03]